MKQLKTGLCIAVIGLALSACEPIKTDQGYHLDPEQLALIQTGVTSKDAVQEIMGSPSSIATFQTEGDAWYYISSKTEHYAFFAKEVKERNIVIVLFDIDDVVAEVADLSLEDGQEIEIVQRETPTGGRELSLLEQLFGNLGRFNTAGEGQ
ncbi:MAG: outer membrane protein assembly factor BamE [Sneathiella sp.]